MSDDAADDPCAASNDQSLTGLRIGSIFIILATSLFGTFLPVFLRGSRLFPRWAYEFAKFFGTGVIIATAFIHLLAPAFDELGSECLKGTWTEYDWAPAFAMIAVYFIFFAEIAAYRIGSAKLSKLNLAYSAHADDATDAHGHDHQHDPPLAVDTSAPHDQFHTHPSRLEDDEGTTGTSATTAAALHEKKLDVESAAPGAADPVNQLPSKSEAVAQLVAIAVLEFGIILHSIIIGLTLAVNEDFKILFIVIVFHQMFEGLGLGSRLSALVLPRELAWTKYAAGGLYAICTPIGIAAGLGARASYNGNGVAANISSGVLDALSAGILLYTGLVELMGHEIVFNPRMMKSNSWRLAYIFSCMLLGSGLMALLGRWA